MTQPDIVPETTGHEVTVDDLSDQITTIKAEIATLTRSMATFASERGQDAVDHTRDRANQAIRRGSDHLDEFQQTLAGLPAEAESAVRRQPVAAMGIAVGVGFLIGLMTSRR